MLQPVPVNRVNIKPNDEGREQPNVGQHWDSNEDTFPVLVKSPKGDVGQEGKGEQHAAEETKDVGDVVDPRQQAAQEEEEDDAQQFEEGLPWLLQDLPALKQLNKEASKESKLRPCWTHLGEETKRKRQVTDYSVSQFKTSLTKGRPNVLASTKSWKSSSIFPLKHPPRCAY